LPGSPSSHSPAWVYGKSSTYVHSSSESTSSINTNEGETPGHVFGRWERDISVDCVKSLTDCSRMCTYAQLISWLSCILTGSDEMLSQELMPEGYTTNLRIFKF